MSVFWNGSSDSMLSIQESNHLLYVYIHMCVFVCVCVCVCHCPLGEPNALCQKRGLIKLWVFDTAHSQRQISAVFVCVCDVLQTRKNNGNENSDNSPTQDWRTAQEERRGGEGDKQHNSVESMRDTNGCCLIFCCFPVWSFGHCFTLLKFTLIVIRCPVKSN